MAILVSWQFTREDAANTVPVYDVLHLPRFEQVLMPVPAHTKRYRGVSPRFAAEKSNFDFIFKVQVGAFSPTCRSRFPGKRRIMRSLK
ncbi:MAG: hypothetical protein M5R41_18980 [Bacteroidia bacterium]|nr:hypothetical protein [Bacteroidia bacterium]